MKSKAIILILLALLILGIVTYWHRPGVSTFHIDPHAAEQIEKAKQR